MIKGSQINDRELLRLAAKAAVVEYDGVAAKDTYSGYYVIPWNPLTNDGDALRLSAKLNIEIAYDDELKRVNAGVWRADAKWNETWDCLTPYGKDKEAATRRAIVRAAAEIGKEMQ